MNSSGIDYLFETSWEICNKVGGIYTVLSTKALTAENLFHDHYLCIGPDLLHDQKEYNDFIENDSLYRNWKEQALSEGLRVRIGRWRIRGNPIAILIDFTPFFEHKNEIFTQFWLDNKLDSIDGQWDYIEPALFGYASAKVIESFYNFYCSSNDKIVAHFHEWMTGTGILYLHNNIPQIATVFTTHATALGRAIAGNGLPLYGNLDKFNISDIVSKFNLKAKFSLEKLSALLSDTFTTVSSITGKECEVFLNKKPDIITNNGFENDIVPQKEEYDKIRTIARNKLKVVTSALLLQKIPENALFVINSGRYEFHNKGIDVFIAALGRLQSQFPKRTIVAVIAVPASTSSQKEELIQRIAEIESKGDNYKFPEDRVADQYPITSPLHKHHSDPILMAFQQWKLNNARDSNVKVVFAPVYLDGFDQIFNISYYNLLPGFDLSVFPSYYEPWGYTPLESAAFGIPTITTSLSGFGQWANENFEQNNSVIVVDRSDDNDGEVSTKIADYLSFFLSCEKKEKENLNFEAVKISQKALWKNLYQNYLNAYVAALSKSTSRFDLYQNKKPKINSLAVKRDFMPAQWNRISVKSKLPETLLPLLNLANNLWWSWNYEARQLFEEFFGMDNWKNYGENPVLLLQMASSEKINYFVNNEKFIEKLSKVHSAFQNYMQNKPDYAQNKIAYFSMEYGISNELKIFSGGLGMLAGDYLKEASDSNANIIGVGLLYRHGYFTQQVNIHGEQQSEYVRQSFSSLPIHPVKDKDDNWLKVSIAFPGRIIVARLWIVNVGRIKLYLLDCDCSENREEDRSVTATLYGGDNENRIKQEIVLGIGGVRMLNLIGETPDIYHINEGHAAFLSLERIKNMMQEGRLSFNIAIELVKASSLFTTHTPVPAGHDLFNEDLMRKYFSHYPERYNISWEKLMGLGRKNISDGTEKFSMSILASRLSQEINGVSKIHGEVSRKMFEDLYEGHFKEELHIDYVTNGVHYPTWAHAKWQEYHKSLFGENFLNDISNPEIWKNIHLGFSHDLWKIKNQLREELILEVKELLQKQMSKRNESPETIVNILKNIRTDILTIGFARRFATYKRANLLFNNEEKLSKIVNNESKPVMFIFAGKAHPNDKAGQDLIKKILAFSRKPEFMGKIIFLENYDMCLAKKLVSGCDVWLNTPTRPLEASGTSGEKAAMNGVLNCSVLDGWWAEGYCKNTGWAINEHIIFQDNTMQDLLDAETLYSMISDEIAPAFYTRNSYNIPEKWTFMMKENFAEIAPHFTMKRQLTDYYNKLYLKLQKQSSKLKDNELANVTDLVKWKKQMLSDWDNIEIVDVKFPSSEKPNYFLGEKLFFSIVIKTGNINPIYLKPEVLFVEKETLSLAFKLPFNINSTTEHETIWTCEMESTNVGTWNWAIRLTPTHPLLTNDLIFNLIKWINIP